MKTLDEFRTELVRRRPITTAEEIRHRLAGREAEARRRIQRVVLSHAPKPRPKEARMAGAPPAYVRLTRPCLSRVFHTYLAAGKKGQVLGRNNGKLSILFGTTLVMIAEDSPLIEVVKC